MQGQGPVCFEVVARLRPLSAKEREAGVRSVASVQGSQVLVEGDAGDSKGAEIGRATFAFDRCYGPPAQQYAAQGLQTQPSPLISEARAQEQLFHDVGVQLAEFALCSYDACLVAYGQRSAGKSHAVLGNSVAPGLLPQIAEHLLGQQLPDLSISLSVLEITFSDGLRDLLLPALVSGAMVPSSTASSSTSGPGNGVLPQQRSRQASGQLPSSPALAIVEHPALGVCVAGLTEVQCTTIDGLQELLGLCARERAVSATSLGGSSRSHVLFCLRLQRDAPAQPAGIESVPPAAIGARIWFADLASSEAAPGKLGLAAAAASESLAALHHAVSLLSGERRRLSSAASVAAFSSAKLTQLLKGAFLGSSRSTLVAAISPSRADREDTLRTLQFASRVSRMQASQQRRRGMAYSEMLPLLQEQVRSLKQQLSAAGPSSCLVEAVAHWEMVLAQQAQAPNGIEAQEFADRVTQALAAAHRQRGLVLDDTHLATGVPFLSNLSSDSQLAGVLNFPLRRPPAGTVVVGSGKDCNLVLQGVGIPPRLCELSLGNGDEVTLHLLPPSSRQQPARCAVNGQVVRRGADIQLEHGDRIILGWSHAFQLNAPGRAERLGLSAAFPPCSDVDAFNELIPEDSETYCELSLYIEDIREKMSEDLANEFLDLLRSACHLVDEANEITREMRPDVEVKFDVDFVWDIFRRAEDVLVVRVLQLSLTGEPDGETKVLSYWTYPRFCERLVEMRSCYFTFVHQRRWEHTHHPLKDPWFDASLAASRHQAQIEMAAAVSNAAVSGSPKEAQLLQSASAPPTLSSNDCESSTQSASVGGTPSVSGAPAVQQRPGRPVSTGRLQQKNSMPRARSAASASAGGRGAGGAGSVDRRGQDALEMGHKNSRPNSPTVVARSRSAVSDEAAQELDKVKKENAKQSAELRKLKAELLQAERERRLHTEIVDSLRSQLADKDELVAALRVLVQDRSGSERARVAGDTNQATSPQSKPSAGTRLVKVRDEVPGAQEKASCATLPPWGSRSNLAAQPPEDPAPQRPETGATGMSSLHASVSGGLDNGLKPVGAMRSTSPNPSVSPNASSSALAHSPQAAARRKLDTSMNSSTGSPGQASGISCNGTSPLNPNASSVAVTVATMESVATTDTTPQLGLSQGLCSGTSSPSVPPPSSDDQQASLRPPGSVLLQPAASTAAANVGKNRVVTWSSAVPGHMASGGAEGATSGPLLLSSGTLPTASRAGNASSVASNSAAACPGRHGSLSPQAVRPSGSSQLVGVQAKPVSQLRVTSPLPSSPRPADARHSTQRLGVSAPVARRIGWSTTPRTPGPPLTEGPRVCASGGPLR